MGRRKMSVFTLFACIPLLLVKFVSSEDCAIACQTDYSPVCGSDGLTYGNECIMKVQSCIKKTVITKVNDGECTAICGKAIDLVFAVDASGSLKPEGFKQIQDFTNDIIDSFEIGVQKTHVGVVVFSHKAKVAIRLDETFDKDVLQNKVRNISYLGYTTATDDALRVSNKEMFSLKGGVRQYVPQVLIVLTDGKCTACTENVSRPATSLKSKGVEIFSVAIGKKVDVPEILSFVSAPESEHLMQVDSLDKLKTLIKKLSTQGCAAKKGKCPALPSSVSCPDNIENSCFGDAGCDGPQKCCFDGCSSKCVYPLLNCMTPIEIAFALDSSSSIRGESYRNMKEVAKKVVDSFSVSQDNTRFAALLYSSDAEMQFNLVRYDSAQGIKQAIENLPHMKSGTRIDKALRLAKEKIFSLDGYVRQRRPMVLVVVTDGSTNRGSEDLAVASKPLKDFGVTVLAVGVGPEVNRYELIKFASEPTDQNIITAKNFKDLVPNIFSLTEKICREKPGTCPAVAKQTENCVTKVDECKNDFECFGTAKCCSDGCRKVCSVRSDVCKRKVDLTFVIDQSDSIGKDNFETIKEFVGRSIEHFKLGPLDTHVALIGFGTTANIEWTFSDYPGQNLKAARNSLKALRFSGGNSRLDLSMDLANERIYNTAYGMRDNVFKLMVIITDGGFGALSDMRESIKALKSKGVNFVALGVGQIPELQALQTITQYDQDNDRLLLVKRFQNLKQYAQDISDVACFAPAVVPPPSELTKGSKKCGAPKCLKGPKGNRGRQGSTGIQGQPGRYGPPGEQGPQGPKGGRGDPGLQGGRGERGKQGYIGLPGHPGINGIPGVPGVEGRPGIPGQCGIKGELGDVGPNGLRGFDGSAGATGDPGPRGPKGSPAANIDNVTLLNKGVKGDPGDPGFEGPQGPTGPVGETSKKRGDRGDVGDQGEEGDDGLRGDPGKVYKKGEKGAPGLPGDPGPKGGVKVESGNFGYEGPAGIPGIKGGPGETGLPGNSTNEIGEKGEAGATGDKGDTGDPGEIGQKGAKGYPGFPGSVGDTGEAGSRGPKGFLGRAGKPGPKGARGTAGVPGDAGDPAEEARTGEKGKPGIMGPKGETGSQGPIGEKGERGKIGKMGMVTPGKIGDTGEQGIAGPRGDPGLSGVTGMEGPKGSTGSPGPPGDIGEAGKTARKINGDDGMEGALGPGGQRGPTGDPGPDGPRGPTTIVETLCSEGSCPKGRVGNPGPPGPTGETGDKGDVGPAGPKGYQNQCPTCPAGERGMVGDYGLPGRPGQEGPAGETGEPGQSGVEGPNGRPGSVGLPGLPGERGGQGPRGEPGEKGQEADQPEIFDGDRGDRGEQGQQGQRGQQGPIGPNGLRGTKGEKGTPGISPGRGPRGISGDRGSNAEAGARGSKGEPGESVYGEKGVKGVTGDRGVRGLTGDRGEDGPKGPQGAGPRPEDLQQKIGYKGLRGAPGEDGDPGMMREGQRGPTGARGNKGERGDSAVAGDKGPTGSKGRKGAVGRIGPPGSTGRQGSRGPAGLRGEPGAVGPKGKQGSAGEKGRAECGSLEDPTDVAFLLDASASLRQENFNKQKQFVQRIVNEIFPVSTSGNRIGAIQYSTSAKVEIHFDDYFDNTSLNDAIKNIPYLNGASRIDLGLKLARDDLFKTSKGARQGVRKVLILITDGYQTRAVDMISPVKLAKDLKDQGVTIFVMGAGLEIDWNLLKQIASNDNYVIRAEDFDVLLGRVKNIQSALRVGCLKTKGIKGEKGFPGDQGRAGANGPTGDKGIRGISFGGDVGKPGQKGPKGDPGIDIEGSPGSLGLMGIPGSKGSGGEDGQAGQDGPKGYKGPTGEPFSGRAPDGPKGLPGPAGKRGPPGQKLCQDVLKSDLAFFLDSSASVGEDNFKKTKKFVETIVRYFDVSPERTHVSVATYAEESKIEFDFLAYTSQKTLFDAIDRIGYRRGTATYIDSALVAANEQVFTPQNKARPDSLKAVILLTDGQQSTRPVGQVTEELSALAQKLRDKGIGVYVLGIGAEVDQLQLRSMVDVRHHLFLKKDFDSLNTRIEQELVELNDLGCTGEIGSKGLPGLKGEKGLRGISGSGGKKGPRGDPGLKGGIGEAGPPSSFQERGIKGAKGVGGVKGLPGLPGCEASGGANDKPLDIAFLMDASGSLYYDNYDKEKAFVKRVIESQNIGKGFTHVNIMSYSKNATVHVGFRDYYDKTSLLSAVDKIPYAAGNTRIDKALLRAKSDAFSATKGARPYARRVAILLTDGQQSVVPGSMDVARAAKLLRDEDVEIFAVGIGPEIDLMQLNEMVSKPSYVFFAADFDRLIREISKEVSLALRCQGGPAGPSGDRGGLGIAGPPGAKGDPGDKDYGSVGATGRTGMAGDEGPAGLIGRKGQAGQQGDQGDTGSEGVQGTPGLRGKKGDTGNSGAIGDIGPTGSRGPQGYKGFKGQPGEVPTNVIPGPGPKGFRGAKGSVGPIGFPGFPGEPSTVPDGIINQYYKGTKGLKGDQGSPGSPGRDGVQLKPPGALGEKGEKGRRGPAGQKGQPGDFGQTGKKGQKGAPGKEGLRGFAGIKGSVGDKGLKGFQGKQGRIGSSNVGPQGPLGNIGPAGLKGEKGEPGFPGIMGLNGLKGFRGEKGPRGRQASPDDGLRGPKGFSGDQGPAGPAGIQGQKGETLPGEKGVRGEEGPIGSKGKLGDFGPVGPKGFIGIQGIKGIRGLLGEDGDPGSEGISGIKGDMGEIIFNGDNKGERGDFGAIGLQGQRGDEGRRGPLGNQGDRGQKGARGERGKDGLPGLPGERGPIGSVGEQGFEGFPGKVGQPGGQGPAGVAGVAEGFYIVRHSQSDVVPKCPGNYKKLWDGYSWVYSVGNGMAHGQDLANAGSCVRSFNTMPYLFCEINKKCSYSSRNDYMYWLSAQNTMLMNPVTVSAVSPFISRCVVCEAPAVHLAVHSQDTTQPDCPLGWNTLWSGFSFLMMTGSGGTGTGESLTSSGSCLEDFRANPFIECQGARGTCNFFSDKFSFWLTTVDQQTQFQPKQSETLHGNKGHDLKSKISRCRVCTKASASNALGGPKSRNSTSAGGGLNIIS